MFFRVWFQESNIILWHVLQNYNNIRQREPVSGSHLTMPRASYMIMIQSESYLIAKLFSLLTLQAVKIGSEMPQQP